MKARPESLLEGSHGGGAGAFDVEAVRGAFPILDVEVGGKPLVYLDNAATTQKPLAVVDAVQRYYLLRNANVHRGVHYLSAKATDLYEQARGKVARFLGASSPSEIVFVRGATEAINLVASSFGGMRVGAGDEVLLTEMEHHANIVPWQMLSERAGARLRVAPLTPGGDVDLGAFARLLDGPVKMVAVVHVSNSLGTLNPVEEMIRMARARGIPVLLDAAQSVAHLRVDVRALECDFLAFSGHKLFGPTGIGVLWGRRELLEEMPPYQGGGDMIRTVRFEKTTYREPPARFEAGTPHVAGAIGLGAAVDWIESLDRDGAAAWEDALVGRALDRLGAVPGVRIFGAPARRIGVVSFGLDGVHPHDIGTFLDGQGIAIRAGHHCTQPLMRWLGVAATARASFSIYNTPAEVDALAAAVRKAAKFFA